MNKALVLYLTAGYPDQTIFLKAARVAQDEGVDILEVGLPFSDPIADGPVIQKTSQNAIQHGVNFNRTLELSQKLPENLPRVMMTYSNPLFVRGWSLAFRSIASAGFSGCVIPDVPIEELVTLFPFLPDNFYLTPFAAPTTSGNRLKLFSTAARNGAFIYLVSIRGITGTHLKEKSHAEVELSSLTASLRRISHAPIYIGFGVRDGRDAKRLAGYSDGIIVGTAALKALDRGLKPLAKLLRELRLALDSLTN